MKKLALVAAGLALALTPALADNTDTESVTVSGTIVANLEAAVGQNLIMPNLVKPAVGEGATGVTVACTGAADANNTVTYTGNGNPFAHGTAANGSPTSGSANITAFGAATATYGGSTGTCAVVNVAGDSSYAFLVSTGNVSSGTNFSVSAPNCYNAAGTLITGATPVSVVLASGAATIRCGATVTANNNSAATGAFGSFDVTVTYD